MEVSGQLHAPPLYPQEKSLLVPIGKEARWAPEPIIQPAGILHEGKFASILPTRHYDVVLRCIK